jgi:glycosyltransferase involved in cell wall biosynthesis
MKLSVVTAIKDGFEDFAATIPTILGQSHADFEWLVVDDGSATPLANAFPKLSADPRVRLFRNETGQGQTQSLNNAIREARGEWIVRMDGDDLARNDRFAKTVDAMRGPTQLIFSDYTVIDDQGRPWAEIRLRHPIGQPFFDYLLQRNNPVCHPTVSFRRRRADGSIRLYREDLVNAQDYALWKEIYSEGGAAAFALIPEPLVEYRITQNSLSGARAREQREELKAIRENKSLEGVARAQPLLGNSQRDAMQAYRLLYYRFVGHSAPATLREDLALLKSVSALLGLLPKAAFYLLARPCRKSLLRRSFSGIYK